MIPYRNHTTRCPHGFDVSANLCRECPTGRAAAPEREPVVLVPGLTVGSARIVARVGAEDFRIACACGVELVVHRRVLWKARSLGRAVRSSGCRRRA